MDKKEQRKKLLIEEIFEDTLWVFNEKIIGDMEYLLEVNSIGIKEVNFNKDEKDIALYVKKKVKKGEVLIKEKVCVKGTIGEIIKEIKRNKELFNYLKQLKGKSIEEIVKNNVQKSRIDTEEYGIWKYCSFLNHSENENIERKINNEIFEIIAKKDINKGEILVYDYTQSKKLEEYYKNNTLLTKKEGFFTYTTFHFDNIQNEKFIGKCKKPLIQIY